MSSYREKAIAWIEHAKRDFSSYVSEDFPLHFSISNMSDDALDLYSWMLYRDVRSKSKRQGQNDPGNEMLYLVPYLSTDGSVSIFDRYSGRLVASMTPTESGMPVYFGLAKYLTRLGGRGEYDTFVSRFADRDYVHDKKDEKKAA